MYASSPTCFGDITFCHSLRGSVKRLDEGPTGIEEEIKWADDNLAPGRLECRG